MAVKEADPPSIYTVILQILEGKVRILVILNMFACIAFLLVYGLIRLFFGKLRATEKKQVQERMISYMTFKAVFLGAILEPEIFDMMVWLAWFLLIGFLKMFSYIAQERFHHLIDNPLATRSQWLRTVLLLLGILALDVCWATFSAHIFHGAGLSTVLLLLFDCFILFIEASQALIKYSCHLLETLLGADWERKTVYLQYIDFAANMLILLLTLGHYIHIWSLNGVSFTLIDAIIILNLRGVYNKIVRTHASFTKFRELEKHMDEMYPDAHPEELAQLPQDEVCAICLKTLLAAKKLPCGHFFHMSCLRQCLERATGSTVALCPLCRTPVSPNIDPTSSMPAEGESGEDPLQNQPDGAVAGARHAGNANPSRSNNVPGVFRFTNENLPRWLPVPAFSFEVVHNRMEGAESSHMRFFHHPGGMAASPVPSAPSEPPGEMELIAQLSEMFPEVSRHVLQHELLSSNGNIEIAIERLLVGQAQGLFPEEHMHHFSNFAFQDGPAEPEALPVNGTTPNFLARLGAMFNHRGNEGRFPASDSTNPSPTPPEETQRTGTPSSPQFSSPIASDEPIEVRRARHIEAIERRQYHTR